MIRETPEAREITSKKRNWKLEARETRKKWKRQKQGKQWQNKDKE